MDDQNNRIVLTGEDGSELVVEHLDTLEHKGHTYVAFLPAEMTLDSSYDLIIFRVEYDKELNEEVFATIEDPDEMDEVFDLFAARLEDSFEEDEEEEAK